MGDYFEWYWNNEKEIKQENCIPIVKYQRSPEQKEKINNLLRKAIEMREKD